MRTANKAQRKLVSISGGKTRDHDSDRHSRDHDSDRHSQDSKYQILFDQASDAIVTISPDGTIDEANQAFEELSGHLKKELHGFDVKMLVPDPSKLRVGPRTRPLSAEFFVAPGT